MSRSLSITCENNGVFAFLYTSPTINVLRPQTLDVVGVRCLNFVAACKATLATNDLATNAHLLVVNTSGSNGAVVSAGNQSFTIDAGETLSLIWNGSGFDVQQ
jgi:hypothetical protein